MMKLKCQFLILSLFCSSASANSNIIKQIFGLCNIFFGRKMHISNLNFIPKDIKLKTFNLSSRNKIGYITSIFNIHDLRNNPLLNDLKNYGAFRSAPVIHYTKITDTILFPHHSNSYITERVPVRIDKFDFCGELLKITNTLARNAFEEKNFIYCKQFLTLPIDGKLTVLDIIITGTSNLNIQQMLKEYLSS